MQLLKRSFFLLLLTPSLVLAECGFMRSDDAMTIVIGKDATKCFDSAGFRQAFSASLTEALAHTAATRTAARRSSGNVGVPASEALPPLDGRVVQNSQTGGRYFGQR